jgi:Protein of unknown function (DUF992)
MRVLATALAALGLAAVTSMPAEAQRGRIQVGVLECDVEGGVGMILGSQRQMACRYTPSGRRRPEFYTGRVTRFGLDVGVTGRTVLLWAVFAPTSSLRTGALSGTYAGVSAEASLGLGLGARALLGGSDRTIALQPVSVQAQTGVNVAAGVGSLELRAAGR